MKVFGRYDVIVAGGGTAGAAAAINCARLGLKTLVVEACNGLGGSATFGLVTPLMVLGIGEDENCSVLDMVMGRMKEVGSAEQNMFDPEYLKFVLEDLFLEHGGELLYYTTVTDVIMEDNRIVGLVVTNKTGTFSVFGTVVVDATGDADVAVLAGAPWRMGKEDQRSGQPVSFRFEVGNVNSEVLLDFLREVGQETDEVYLYGAHTLDDRVWALGSIFQAALDAGDITRDDAAYFQFFGVPGKKNALAFNCPEIFFPFDCSNPADYTRATVEGRKAILRLMRFLKTYFRGFEEAYVSQTATMVGIRDGRRIVGEYVLSAEDCARYQKFDDAVAQSNYYMDVHNCSEEDLERITKLKELAKDEDEAFYEIPYRCLVPLEVDQLLVAGRCISVDFIAQSTIRVQKTCYALGEACGYAAFLAVRDGVTPRDIPGVTIRNAMEDACIKE